MSIDEALKQLSFVERKGSAIVKEVILTCNNVTVCSESSPYVT